MDNGDGTATIAWPGAAPLIAYLNAPDTGSVNPILEGSITLENALDLERLVGRTELTGNLVVAHGLRLVALPDHKQVGGDRRLLGAILESVSLLALETVGGDRQSQSTQLASLELPALSAIGGVFDVSKVSAITVLVVSALADVGAAVLITKNPKLAMVDLSSLKSTGGHF